METLPRQEQASHKRCAASVARIEKEFRHLKVWVGPRVDAHGLVLLRKEKFESRFSSRLSKYLLAAVTIRHSAFQKDF